MADFKISSRMKVKTLKSNFKEAFGCTLRVYTTKTCKTFADDDATLATLMSSKAKGGSVTIGGNTKVGNFEEKFVEAYGIGVQVANKNDSALADNSITLAAAGK